MSIFTPRADLFLHAMAQQSNPVMPLARLWAGDADPAGRWIAEAADQNDRYVDCADFRLNRMIRMLLLFGDRLSTASHDTIRDSLLSARYYGGWRPDIPMFFSSENHHMNWAVAEYLAAQLFPDAVFTFDGRSAREHRDRARFLIANWIDHRARWGYSEWNSSPYMTINLMSLFNLVDFADEPAIRTLARDATTKTLADVAADSAHGGIWGAQARIYHEQLFDRRNQSAATALWVYCGQDGRLDQSGRFPDMSDDLASSIYEAPDWLIRLAGDLDTPMINREKHRIEEGPFYKDRSLFWRPPIEITDEQARQRFRPDALFPVAVITERRREHLVSAALTQRLPLPHHHNMRQALCWMGCLNGRTPIFTTHPPRPGGRSARRQYWAGTAAVPRCHLHDGVLATLYPARTHPDAAEFTHAHFPTPEFDHWRTDASVRSSCATADTRGGWYFAAQGDAYVGLLPPGESSLTDAGDWAGREIVSPGSGGAWLAVFGSKSRDGDFDAFVARCRAVNVTQDRQASAACVSIGETSLSLDWAGDVVVDGRAFTFDDWAQIDNPIVHAPYGEGVLNVRDQPDAALDLSAAREIKRTWERRPSSAAQGRPPGAARRND